MSGQPTNPELQEALLEFQQYLSDALPPLVVADSIQLLIKYPPEVILPSIRAWTAAQYRGAAGSAVPISDYLFHAIKKIHMIGEFKLVPRQPLEEYLRHLYRSVLALCPQEDHAMLLENLSRLGEQAGTQISPVRTIHRQAPTESGTAATAASAQRAAAGAGGGEPGAAADEAVRGLRRFSMLLERLEAQGGLSTGGGAAAPGAPQAAEALAFAARSSHSSHELDQYMARLKSMGLEAGTDNLFRALAQSLPGWTVPAAEASGMAAPVETRALGAMRRIITEADDPVEISKRFQEMVKAGVERFNEGSLPQAVQMLELADRLIAEKKVDRGSAELVRRKLGETLNGELLRKCSERPDQHALLRKVLDFFTAYTAEGLLEELPREQKRDRRRLILALLEVHGAPARAVAYEALSRVPSTAVGEEEWFFRRNLLYLLRRIPRGPEASPDESETVVRHAQIGLPLVVVKEAVAALAVYEDERTEQGLGELLAQLEGLLARPEGAPYEPKDLRALLDRVAATMARLPSPRARRILIDHAVKKQVSLGDAMARLEELGSQDLSDDADTVAQLLALLKANIPFKLLGLTLKATEQSLVHVVQALAGTPSPAVRRALEDIAARFGGQEAGKVAARAIAAWDKPAASAASREPGGADEPAASLQGDLEVFGLPALLQSLGDSSASGMLTLRGLKGGEVFATLSLREGKLEEIHRGKLRGEEAFYQLLERPTPGQFAFVKGAPPPRPGAAALQILPLTLEAMRRYDEFQEAATLVPDTVHLEATSTRPTPHPAEKDGAFLQALWARASQGGTPLDCEDAVASDSYRIRRLLAHWVEQGALKIRGNT